MSRVRQSVAACRATPTWFGGSNGYTNAMRALIARLRRIEYATNGRLTPLVTVVLALVVTGFLACIVTNRSSVPLIESLAATGVIRWPDSCGG